MVALKEVSVSTDADRRAVRTEMRALRTQRSPLLTSTFTTELASCPRIVDYYGSIVRENGNACIAVEYVAGGSLGSWLDSGLRCPEAWIAHIAHQALEVSQDLLRYLVPCWLAWAGVIDVIKQTKCSSDPTILAVMKCVCVCVSSVFVCSESVG